MLLSIPSKLLSPISSSGSSSNHNRGMLYIFNSSSVFPLKVFVQFIYQTLAVSIHPHLSTSTLAFFYLGDENSYSTAVSRLKVLSRQNVCESALMASRIDFIGNVVDFFLTKSNAFRNPASVSLSPEQSFLVASSSTIEYNLYDIVITPEADLITIYFKTMTRIWEFHTH